MVNNRNSMVTGIARMVLLDHIRELSESCRSVNPFASTVLQCLAGALETDVDRDLAESCLDFMLHHLRESRALLDAETRAIQEAISQGGAK